MRALVFRGPWDIGVEDRPDPRPGPGEVLVNVVATGICGSDLHGFTGENGRRFPGQVMGHETVGRVAAAGPDVDASVLAVGTLVTVEPVLACGTCPACRAGQDHRCPERRIIGVDPSISSAFADLVVVPAVNAVPLPDRTPPEYGALVEPLAVGQHAIVRGHCGTSDTVLVIGGGPIGQACALAARRAGVAGVVVSEPSAGRRSLLTDIGVAAVDPTSGALAEGVVDALGTAPSVVVDAVGSSRSMADALSVGEDGGRVVLVGMQEPDLSLRAYAVSIEERTVIGSYCYPAKDFHDTAAWVATAPPELARLIEGRVGWSDAPEAFRSLANGENPASKVIVLPNGE